MTSFPLSDCCELLSIDPKTLRQWRQQAAMALHVHPSDRRRKCLTLEQVQQLAVLHGHALKPHEVRPTAPLVEISSVGAPKAPPRPQTINDMRQGETASAVLLEEENLRQKLSQLEAQVVAQQQQLVLLTRELLQERATRTERRLSPLDAHAQPMAAQEISRHENLTLSVPIPLDGGRPLHPAEQRARFLVLPPLIEYGAGGTYVVISSQEGELHLIPDTLEWFEWFRTLSSFRFVGKCGHFGACRGYNRRPTRTWYAHRTIHQHEYRHYLGLSERLTIAHLEQMAARLQSHLE